jgi:hypothetical protein
MINNKINNKMALTAKMETSFSCPNVSEELVPPLWSQYSKQSVFF